ncbi:MAG: glycoside hydrolase family 2 TIM barrel-domain containing protein [Candidatus Neomarinimicrobiota bacterium]
MNFKINPQSLYLFTLIFIFVGTIQSQDADEFFSRAAPQYNKHDELMGWIDSRQSMNLNGDWHYIVDPMNNGLPEESFFGGFPQNKLSSEGFELIEYHFENASTMQIPGAWNAHDKSLFFYRGPIWFYKKFNFSQSSDSSTHLYIGASNFNTKVFLNGDIVGSFEGGYTSFNFDITRYLQDGPNILIIQVDNTLSKDSVPTKKTDWWPYGGILGDVLLISTPELFIQNAYLQLSELSTKELLFKAQLNLPDQHTVKLSIPELGIEKEFISNSAGLVMERFKIDELELWSTNSPKLYSVNIESGEDKISDNIGFRDINVIGKKIFLNGEEIKFRGISMHAEPISEEGFAFSKDHFKKLINAAKSLNVNFIRAAHYPYTRHLAKLCDEAGILLWEEIPVYWNINWANPETEAVAESMLSQLIKRDWNRASIVIWSLGNETPFSPERMKFMLNQKQTATTLDSSRLISAALLSGNAEQFRSLVYFLAKEGLRHDFVLPEEKAIFKNIVGQMKSLYQDYDHFFINIDDPLAEYLDVIAYNEYFGWYYTSFLVDQIGVRESTLRQLMFKIMPTIKIKSEFNKPIHISEFGAGAKINYPYKDQIWSEEYQNKVYEHQLEMIKNNPQIQGISPWILKDFRSMMRPLADVQDYYNRKGLIDEQGRKKKAFDTLADYYAKEW